jgi:hypothetical protein
MNKVSQMELEWNRKVGSNVLENLIAVIAEVSAGCIMLDLPISPPEPRRLYCGVQLPPFEDLYQIDYEPKDKQRWCIYI